ncbi:hypothetical protein ACFSX9_12705 [Flavobacterium ardleyense]|uniref:SH3 domain-containing protein n=1 Tax=Flavobacterium ardleyense TaxID=2038737 RepID=A0ABW5ZBE5_9FLAO
MKSTCYLLILLVSVQLSSCKKKESTIVVANNLQDVRLTDTIPNEDNIEDEIRIKYGDLIIYPLNSYEKVTNKSTGFIPLTDIFPWSEHKDSIAIADEYLGNNEIGEFHTLSEKYRTRFFKLMKIKETDKVFIYNYRLDSIYTFQVKELPLLAHISLYGAEAPIHPDDYLIGFDLENKLSIKDMGVYYDALVYVGSENPFNQGKIKPIIWKKIPTNQFPKEVKSEKIDATKISKLYKFQINNLDYYLLNDNHLVIVESANKKIILEEIFVEGESASSAPLSFDDVVNESLPEQWTGDLFKNKPPVFFGFLYQSFGCSAINFIEKPYNSIYLHCDNRH